MAGFIRTAIEIRVVAIGYSRQGCIAPEPARAARRLVGRADQSVVSRMSTIEIGRTLRLMTSRSNLTDFGGRSSVRFRCMRRPLRLVNRPPGPRQWFHRAPVAHRDDFGTD